ncbi:MAG: nucleoside triphosphate pyrophosphohydrolase family protein [Pseudomonadota bacterium]
MTKEGMFKRVSDMNTAFGNQKGDPVNIDWHRLEKQCKNILGEYKELLEALEARDLDGVRDALCDINVFSLGAHHFMGIDADADMDAVVDGVLTRFCKDEADLEATKVKYNALGVEYYVEGGYPYVCLKSSKDQDDINGEHFPKGKFLKSASFNEPVLPKVA